MTRSDKNTKAEERYMENMQKWKTAYKERTDFSSKFTLKPEKTKGMIKGVAVTGTTQKDGSAEAEKKADSGVGSPSGGSELGVKCAEFAATWIGKVVYLFGAKNPETGYCDCSGFSKYVYQKTANINVGDGTGAQAGYGTEVKKEDALPGDMVMFQGTYRAGPSHVGVIYEGTKFVHCGGNDYTGGVKWGDLTEAYWVKHYLSIRRVIPDNDKGGNKPKPAEGGDKKDEKKEVKTVSADAKMDGEFIPDRVYQTDEEYVLQMYGGKIPENFTTCPDAPLLERPPASWIEGEYTYNPVKLNVMAGYFWPHTMNRANFLYQRIQWARKNSYKVFEKLDPQHFIHVSRHDGFEGNIYSPDAKRAFEIFRLKAKRDKLEILSGFRFSPTGLMSPHEAGCAIDVRVYGKKDAKELADIAWACGFRAMAIGGDIDAGTGFLHLDIGPKSQWGYDDIPIYLGPGRWDN